MSMSTSIGYAAAGVIVAASAITATLATFGLGGETAAIAVATAGAEQALVTTPGGSTIPLAPGEQITSTEVVQTPAGPIEYVYVAPAPAVAPARGGDDDDDEHENRGGSRDDDDDDDDDHEHDKREDRRESRSTSRGDRR